ncbi:hypothetical protein K7432_010936 [Basidiobolus ranarum]|uniref:C2H2-type domain-containing protein n=1 Tax=Basidiobolus ranarum TaxID=34480 RepID=A0ABR2VUP5_9FUNG
MPLSQSGNSNYNIYTSKSHDMNVEGWFYTGSNSLLSTDYYEKQNHAYIMNSLPPAYYNVDQIPCSGLTEYIDKPRMASVSFPVNGSVPNSDTGLLNQPPSRKRASMPYLSPHEHYSHSPELEIPQHNLNTILDTSLFLQPSESHKSNSFCLTPEFSSSGSASPDPSPQFDPFFDHSSVGFLGETKFAHDIISSNSKSNQFISETEQFIKEMPNLNSPILSSESYELPTMEPTRKISADTGLDSIPNKIKFIHCNPSKGIHSSTSKAIRYYPGALNDPKFGNISNLPFNVVDGLDSQDNSRNSKEKKGHFCPYCSRHFRRRHDLHRHIRLHTGERPYSCDICTKAFYRTDALKRHYRSEHKISLPVKS